MSACSLLCERCAGTGDKLRTVVCVCCLVCCVSWGYWSEQGGWRSSLSIVSVTFGLL